MQHADDHEDAKPATARHRHRGTPASSVGGLHSMPGSTRTESTFRAPLMGTCQLTEEPEGKDCESYEGEAGEFGTGKRKKISIVEVKL